MEHGIQIARFIATICSTIQVQQSQQLAGSGQKADLHAVLVCSYEIAEASPQQNLERNTMMTTVQTLNPKA
jgi:hypothetical protein